MKLFAILTLLLSQMACSQVRVTGKTNVTGNTNLNVNSSLHVASIAISPTNQSQNVGGMVGYAATVTLNNGKHYDVTSVATWTSNNPAIASKASLFTLQNFLCNSASTALITVAFGSFTASTNLTCISTNPLPTLTSIQVLPTNPNISVGQTQGFTASGTYSDGTTQNLTSIVTWSSGTPANAVLGTLGTTQLVNCIHGGTSVITATSGVTSGNTTLTCNAVLLTITVTPVNPIVLVGAQPAFIATGGYNDGSSQDVTVQSTWTSGTPAVASIGTKTTTQIVNALSAGTSTITATIGLVSGNTTLTVTNPAPPPPTLTSVVVTPANATVNTGQTLSYIATCHYSDGSTSDCTAGATWVSTSTSVATISGTGAPRVASCLTAGSTTLQATVTAVLGSTTLTCQTPVPTLTSITVAPTTPTQTTGSSVLFTAKGTYSDASTQDLTSRVAWTSSAPTIAQVLASANPQPVKCLLAGTSTITATLGAVSGNTLMTCTVPAVAVGCGTDGAGVPSDNSQCGATGTNAYTTEGASGLTTWCGGSLPGTCTQVTTCNQTLTAGTNPSHHKYYLTTDLNCGVATLASLMTSYVDFNLNTHTVIGVFFRNGPLKGYHLFNGTVNCTVASPSNLLVPPTNTTKNYFAYGCVDEENNIGSYIQGGGDQILVHHLSGQNSYGGTFFLKFTGAISVPAGNYAVPTTGTIHYVATTGNDSNPGTLAQPWLTLAHAATVTTTAGNTVIVENGTYNLSGTLTFGSSGSSGKPITFASQSKWGATLQCPSGLTNCIVVNGNFVTVEGFELIGSSDGTDSTGIKCNSGSNCTVSYNKIHHFDTENTCLLGAAIEPNNASGHSIIGNLIYDVSPPRTAARCNHEQGIYVSGTGASNGTISNNLILECYQCYGIQFDGGNPSGWVVTNNTLANVGQGAPNNAGGGIYFNCANSGATCDNIQFNNNIFYNTGGDSCITEATVAPGGTNGTHNTYANNEFFNCFGGNNFIHGTLVNSVNADPKFVNYTGDQTGDYHPMSSSPAIVAGTTTGAPATDFDGVTRSGIPWIGAYQTSGTLGGWTEPAIVVYNNTCQSVPETTFSRQHACVYAETQPVEYYNNLGDVGSTGTANATQLLEIYSRGSNNGFVNYVHNNKLTCSLFSFTTGDTCRPILCDGALSCLLRYNDIYPTNSRCMRLRDAFNAEVDHNFCHGLVASAGFTGVGTHTGDNDIHSGQGEIVPVNIHDNTFELGPGGWGHTARSQQGTIAESNTYVCASGGCTGALIFNAATASTAFCNGGKTPCTVTVNAANSTFTQSSGSYSLGTALMQGSVVQFTGFVHASNNVQCNVTNVTPFVITVGGCTGTGLVAETISTTVRYGGIGVSDLRNYKIVGVPTNVNVNQPNAAGPKSLLNYCPATLTNLGNGTLTLITPCP